MSRSLIDTAEIRGLANSAVIDTTNAANITSGTLSPSLLPYLSAQVGNGTNSNWFFAGAGNSSLTGSYNLGVGPNTLSSLTSGSNNVAFGIGALQNNVTGTANFAMGVNALNANTGNSNSAIGYGALSNNTSGGNNSALGAGALGSNVSGSSNVAMGNAAIGNNNGSFNSAFGFNALYDATSCNYNTVLGYNTGRGITTGSYNTILGSLVTGLASGLSNNVILADGAGNIRLQDNNGAMTINSPLTIKNCTYAGRPASPAAGTLINISDATVYTWGSTVSAGGSVHNVLARWDGANWTVVGS